MSNAVDFSTMSLDELKEDLEKNKAILEKAAAEQGLTPENIEEKLISEHQKLAKEVAEVQKNALEAAFRGDTDATAGYLQEMRSLTDNNWALAYTKYKKGVSALDEKASARLTLLSAAPALLTELNEKYKRYREVVLAGQKANGVTDENLQAKFQEEQNRLEKNIKELVANLEEAVKAGNEQEAQKLTRQMNELSESSWATALGQVSKIRKVEEAFHTILEYFGKV